MKIIFHRPEEPNRVGGLDLAINDMRNAMISTGAEVVFRDTLSQQAFKKLTKDGALGWFHGIWEKQYIADGKCYVQSGSRYAVSPHGMLEPWAFKHKAWKKKPYYHLFAKKHLRAASALFATGNLEEQNLRTLLPQAAIERIPLGLECVHAPDYQTTRAALGWNADEKILLFLSRIHPKKGLHELIIALKELKPELPENLRLVIIGDGDPEHIEGLTTTLKKNAGELPRIDFIGPVWGDEKWAYLQGADLFCLTTFSENFGLAVLEAASVGTPILTTHQTPWAIHREDPGFFIVDPGINGAKVGLELFLKTPAWSKTDRLQFAQKMKANYSWSTLAIKYRTVFDGM